VATPPAQVSAGTFVEYPLVQLALKAEHFALYGDAQVPVELHVCPFVTPALSIQYVCDEQPPELTQVVPLDAPELSRQ
jgi:hypothetical protein